MSVWSANLEALRVRMPAVAQRTAAAAVAKSRRAKLSPEDASRVATRWVGARMWREGAFLAVSGFGNGTHVRALLATLPERTWIFVAESDPAELRATFEEYDLRDVLADPRLMLGTGALDDAFFGTLENPWILEVTDVERLIFAPCYNAVPEYYARFFTEFARRVDVIRKLYGTWLRNAVLWQTNTFENLPALAAAPDVAVLRDAFRGRAMVLVSAGPSLDESLDFLREASRTALIVAVNSSYRAVRHAGIVPSLVLAADPWKYAARGFEGVPVDGTWLVTTPIVDPAVVRLFDGRMFTWSGSNQLVTELRRRAGLPPGTTLIERGTVSACAVDLAVVLGCDRVCLVGQDLAIRTDGRTHAQDSFYTDINANGVPLAGCRLLPGNTFAEVPVEEKLFVYLKTFEQLVQQRTELKFLNTARLGARIAGVPYATFAEAVRWLGETPIADATSVVAQRHARTDVPRLDFGRINAALASTGDYTRSVLGAALRAAYAAERVPERFAAENHRDAPPVRAALEAADALRELIHRQPRDYEILESGRTRMELHLCREAQSRIAPCAEHWRRVLASREYAWAIAEGAWFLEARLRGLERAASAPEAVVKQI
jgi:hypothetical protein